MKKFCIFSVLLLLLPLLVSCGEKQIYIVYFGEHSADKAVHEREDTHHSYLLSVKENKEEEARASLLYSYKHSINGFAALLTQDEASNLSKLDGVLSVFPSNPRKYSLHTTRSWDFVGLDEGEGHWRHFYGGDDLLMKARYGREVIVGMLDSGAWPESESFNDKEMGPIPKSWKGTCETGNHSFHCNKKLIGGRTYIKAFEQYYGHLNISEDVRSPRDLDGHGTHTASTVAGSRVSHTSALGGFASGTASGGAPLAHLAIYKVCWAVPGQSKAEGNTCFEADMLAAMDDAIGDGVNVLSISIGTAEPVAYKEDGIALGALHAVKKNIVVVCSAGNSGPVPGSVVNPAPWIMTVGASSLDRAFIAPVVLGNGIRFEGQTVTPYKLQGMHQLVFAGDVELPNIPKNVSGQCLPESLSTKAKGKIVLCMRGAGLRVKKGLEVKRAGGAAFILGNAPANGNELTVDAHVLPATAVGSNDAIKILNYIKSNKNPMASIFPATTTLHTRPAPFMAAFSSRGPNMIDHNILKPDITAPGINILAAWSEGSSPSKLAEDKRVVKFNVLSGTSMSCPHVAAAASLIKAIHPYWSSAAIRSALMTTASLRNNMGGPLTDSSGKVANPLAYGAGHFNPIKAADPGLVYDSSYTDYLLYLCNYGLPNLDPSFKCPNLLSPTNTLNYPSLSLPKLNSTVTVKRTVTNVGGRPSVYFASVLPPLGYSVKVSPSILVFKHFGEKKKFTITVEARKEAYGYYGKDEYAFGWYTWRDGVHAVKSPMAFSLA